MSRVISLTVGQMNELEPDLARIAEMASEGRPGMLIAQVFSGHMRVMVVSHETAGKVQQAVGMKRMGGMVRSAHERPTYRKLEVVKNES